MAKPLLIFGVGPFPEQVHYYFSQHAGRRVEAFTVDAAFLTTSHFAGLPVLPFEEAQRRFPPDTHELFVAVGYTHFNRVRKRVFLDAQAVGYTLPSFVHETATVARNVFIGANTFLREQAVVSPFATIGDNVSVGAQATISHHTRIASHVWLAAAGVVCGGAVVGECSFIGANATVRDRIIIGERCIVGAGALIMSDCAADGVYAAAPTPRRDRS
jgi:sugar O-acyltransferase (sialic acid O-acetyltransferase NeuD family)